MGGKEYWVTNGTSSSYDFRGEIKAQGGYFDGTHKCWAIKNPSEECKILLKNLGLRLEFRRDIA